MAIDARALRLDLFARAATSLVAARDLQAALSILADGLAGALDADLSVIRIADQDGALVARAVAPGSSPLAAELAGSRAREPLGADEVSLPTHRVAARARASVILGVPVREDGHVVGLVEVVRLHGEGTDDDRFVLELAAAQLLLLLRAFPDAPIVTDSERSRRLHAAAEAIGAGAEPRCVPEEIAAVVAEVAGARGAVLWRIVRESLDELAVAGGAGLAGDVDRALAVVREEKAVVAIPGPAPAVVVLLGRPATHVLELTFAAGGAPRAAGLAALEAFGAQAARALVEAERVLGLEAEIERTRTLYEIVAEASSHLSLAHTLQTAIERVVDLLHVERVGVYLLEESDLRLVAGRELAGGHERVADAILEVARGPLRARGSLLVTTGKSESIFEPLFEPIRKLLHEVEEPAVLGVPLHVREQAIGLLVAYPGGRPPGESDISLLSSLASQLAVAVQNARLHEQATELGAALGGALASERHAARQLRALYDISQSFTESLSFDTTLDAVTRAFADVLGVDAAVMRMPDERGDLFVARAVHVRDSGLTTAVRTILSRPQRRSSRDRQPLLLDPDAARKLGGAHALLAPFLEKGSTAAIVPLVSGGALLAQLTILSLDPAARIGPETLATARTIAQQAVLAIDNARLYQQQKEFAEAMQQSLLPRDRPRIEGLEVGTVYESAAELDVGGDVFDFLELSDGRLAVVLGDVTGHGVDATADMAMAKFVFRSLAREHTDPATFLARANDVVVGEIAPGKFITMTAVVVAPGGELFAASAGHPSPRIIRSRGVVDVVECRGLALGIVAPQEYVPARAEVAPGDAVVLYTDGVVEARRGRELFGDERLDAVLREHAGESAQGIADAVIDTCRAFAPHGLGDDCAIVVIRRPLA